MKVIDTPLGFLDTGRLTALALNDYIETHLDRFLSDCRNGRGALSESETVAVARSVFQMDHFHPVAEALEFGNGIYPRDVRPVRIDLEEKIRSVLKLVMDMITLFGKNELAGVIMESEIDAFCFQFREAKFTNSINRSRLARGVKLAPGMIYLLFPSSL